MFITAVFTIAKRQKNPKCSTDEQIKKICYSHIISDNKRNEVSDTCHNVDEPRKHYAK